LNYSDSQPLNSPPLPISLPHSSFVRLQLPVNTPFLQFHSYDFSFLNLSNFLPLQRNLFAAHTHVWDSPALEIKRDGKMWALGANPMGKWEKNKMRALFLKPSNSPFCTSVLSGRDKSLKFCFSKRVESNPAF
jgi:hypothetical protein